MPGLDRACQWAERWMMNKSQKWCLAILGSLLLALGGLFWDAMIHSQEHAHMIEEPLFNLTNPGHVIFGLGFVLAVLITLVGFTVGWLQGRRWSGRWQMLSIPATLWIAMGLAGVITLVALARLG